MPSYRIQSVNTLFYVLSTQQDKKGQQVNTQNGKNSVPPNSVLKVNPRISGPVTPVTITGVSGLYVALVGTAENTKLTWSNEPYTWNVSVIGDSHVVTPANGTDLYWFDEFNVGVGNHVEVRAGRNIKVPQNEWTFRIEA